jgi:hypothetical protein
MIVCRVKEPISEEEPNVPNDPAPDVSTLTRIKASLTKPIDHIAPIYMIVASRA